MRVWVVEERNNCPSGMLRKVIDFDHLLYLTQSGGKLKLETEIVKADVENKTLTTDKGDIYEYGPLLLATGSAFLNLADFKTAGAEAKGVLYPIDVCDADKIVDSIKASKGGEAVVVGGYIGLELAASLTVNKIILNMVFPDACFMPRLFTPELASFYEGCYEGKGVNSIKGTSVTALRFWRSTVSLRLFLTMLSCSWIAPAIAAYPTEARTLGVNYGRLGDNLPTSSETVKLIQGLGIGRVRIFDHDGPTIKAFAGSGLEFIIGMGNDEIAPMGADAGAADAWIVANVVPYYPATNIVYILVGNELFADPARSSTWPQVIPAIQNLHTSLQNRNLSSIHVSTAAEFGILALSFPPSKGAFRPDVAASVMTPLLQYLNSTDSYLFVNVYPYFGWSANSQYIPLDYALFTRNTTFTTDGQYEYTYLLDAQVDAMAAAMAAVGYGNVRIALSETGWPTIGDSNELGANLTNAQVYNQNLVRHVLSNPTKGTPMRPGIFIPTFIFALFNENSKPGPTTERNWGLLYPNGKPVYAIDIKSASAPTPGGSPGGQTPGVAGLTGNRCHGKPSVLPMSASFFGSIFNLRI